MADNNPNFGVSAGQNIDPETQARLNKPIEANIVFDQKDKEFLYMIVDLVNTGKINLLSPSTLLNTSVYDQLSEDKQGTADFESLNMLAAIRDIKGLFDAGFENSFQMQNLVQRLRNAKERFESVSGNVFII